MVLKGQIYLVDLGPHKQGSEQMGVRPCIILQGNLGNKHSTTTIIALLTSKEKKTKTGKNYPMQVPINSSDLSEGKLLKSSLVLCEQIYTVDKESRLLKKLGQITDQAILKQIDNAVKVSLGIE